MDKLIFRLTLAIFLTVMLLAGPAGLQVAQAEDPEPWTPAQLPGTLEGAGTLFQVSDSTYLNVTLESTEIISITLSSFPSVLELRMEASAGPLSTQLTLSGLAPGLEYHKYEDDLQNHVVFVADATGSYAWVQDLTTPHLLFIQTMSSTYFIQDNLTGGQCTLIGSWDDASNTCTLGMDLSDTIQISNSGITLDGAGHLLTGSSNKNSGVYIPGSVSGVTVQNLTISGFRDGIALVNATGCTIRNNTIDSVTRFAVSIDPSPKKVTGGNQVIQNNIRGAKTGIYLKFANGNQIRGNWIDGHSDTSSIGIDIDGSSNAVTGNRVLFTNTGIQNKGVNNYQRNTVHSSFAPLDGSLGAFFNNNLYAYSFPFFAYTGSQALYTNPPLGGNYWEAYDALEENCLDSDLNGFCDAPYVAANKNGVQAGIDAYPWTRPDGWFDIQPIVAPIDPLLIGSNVPTSAHFVDLVATTSHTAIWDWGDGTQSAGLVSEAGGVGDVTGSHIYNTTGVFEVRLTMTDYPFLSEVQEVFQYVVIYDPTAGFVTGGGWIISPLGAYVPDPTLTGHATFGFISKYYRTKTSGSELGGSTVFEFHAAGMRFKSSTYDWLVVNSNKAMFKGWGYINDDLNTPCGFILTAVDEGSVGDKFRIQIWAKDTEQLIYDNKIGAASNDLTSGTVISSGSIIIH